MSDRKPTIIREARLRKWDKDTGDYASRRVWIVENHIGPPSVELTLEVARATVLGAWELVTAEDVWIASGMWRDKAGNPRGSAEPRDQNR